MSYNSNMTILCRANRKQGSDELEKPGDYCIIEKRGMTDEEFTQAVTALKEKLSPRGIFQKAYWRIAVRKPVEETPKYIHGVRVLLKKKNIWPNYRALLLVCPKCKVPYSSTKEHSIIVDEHLTLNKEIECPYGKNKVIIQNGKIYEFKE